MKNKHIESKRVGLGRAAVAEALEIRRHLSAALSEMTESQHAVESGCLGCQPMELPAGFVSLSDTLRDSSIAPSADGLTTRVPLNQIRQRSSRPGAPVTVYLDFDGEAPFVWHAGQDYVACGPGGPSTPIPAFSLDANLNDYTDPEELDAMDAIWAHVSEKFSPFDINVTTVRPATFNDAQAIHMIIGGSKKDWWQKKGSGVAPVEGFTKSELSNEGFMWSADWIAAGSTTLSDSSRHFIAETAAHEAGHLFGLNHQSTVTGGVVTDEYSVGDSSTVPVMGASNGINTKRGIWFNGQTSSTNSNGDTVPTGLQDDLAVMTRAGTNIHFRPDDFGSYSGSGSLTVNSQSGFATGAGVIETIGDQDAFSFVAIGPVLSFTVEQFSLGGTLVPGMLAPTLELVPLGSGGSPNWSVTTTNTSATLTTTNAVPGGGYLLRVSPQGNAYGNLGQYTISGNLGVFASNNAGRITITGYDNTHNDILISYHSSTDEIVLQNDVYGGSAVQRWPRSQVNSIVVNAQGGNDFIDVLGDFSALSIPITANGGGGDDYLYFSGTEGNDFQTLETATFGHDNNTPVTFSGIEKVIMHGFDGADTQRLYEVPANLSVTCYGGGQDDALDLGYGDLSKVQGPVYYSGDGGFFDTVIVQNEYSAFGWNHTINPNSVVNSRPGFTHTTNMSQVEVMRVGASNHDDVIFAPPTSNFAYEVYGRGGNDTIDLRGGSSAMVRGGDGDDRFLIGGGYLIGAPTSVQLFGELGNDTLVLDNHLDTSNQPWSVYGFVSNASPFNNKVYLAIPGVGGYDYSQFEGLEMLGGPGPDTFTFEGQMTSAITANGGGGNDTFSFAAFSVNWVRIPGATIVNPVSIDGGSGFNVLSVDDNNLGSGDRSMAYDIYPQQFKSSNLASTTGLEFTYDNMNEVNIFCGEAADSVDVYGTSADIPSNDQLSILTGAGDDDITVHAQDATGNLTINGNLGVSGGDGNDSIDVTAASGTNPMHYRFSNPFGPGTQDIFGVGAAGIGTAGIEVITVTGSSGSDELRIDEFTSGAGLAVNGGSGDDRVYFGASTMETITNMASFSFDGQAGSDLLILNNSAQNIAFAYARNAGSTAAYGTDGTDGKSYLLNDSNTENVQINAGPLRDLLRVNAVAAGTEVTFNSGGGIDGLLLGEAANSVEQIRGRVTYDTGPDGGHLAIYDGLDTSGDIVHIDSRTVGAYAGDNLFGPGGSVSFTDLTNYSIFSGILLNLGSGADTIYAQPLPNGRVTINAANPTASPGDQLNLALAAAQNVAITNGASGNVTSSNCQTLNWTGIEQPISTDAVRPTVQQSQVNVDGVVTAGSAVRRQAVDVRFSENVAVKLSPSSLELRKDGTGPAIPASYIALNYDAATNTAHFTFPGYPNGVLPDGNYVGRISTDVTDLFGNELPAQVEFGFFVLAGDANRDRKVDVADLGIFASNWQQSPRTFSQGDFDYSGTVDVNDLGILASHWQQQLAPPPAPFAPAKARRATPMRLALEVL